MNNVDTSPSAKNTPPDVHNIKNFPAITKQVAVQVNVDKTKNSNKINRNINANKNVKNNVNTTTVGCGTENTLQNDHGVSIVGGRSEVMFFAMIFANNCHWWV